MVTQFGGLEPLVLVLEPDLTFLMWKNWDPELCEIETGAKTEFLGKKEEKD
jgi:hypothetical protein